MTKEDAIERFWLVARGRNLDYLKMLDKLLNAINGKTLEKVIKEIAEKK